MCETTSLKQSKLKDSDIDQDTLIELFADVQTVLVCQSAAEADISVSNSDEGN